MKQSNKTLAEHGITLDGAAQKLGLDIFNYHPSDVYAAIKKLQAERDEADRRAGAAGRYNAYLEDSQSRHQSWLRKAKKEAGYEDYISFDKVWAETLTKAQAHDKQQKKPIK